MPCTHPLPLGLEGFTADVALAWGVVVAPIDNERVLVGPIALVLEIDWSKKLFLGRPLAIAQPPR